jgi:hypothetical protein
MVPVCGSGYSQEVKVSISGRGEIPAEMWSEIGVNWSDVADAKSGTRTTIFRGDKSILIIEPRLGTEIDPGWLKHHKVVKSLNLRCRHLIR